MHWLIFLAAGVICVGLAFGETVSKLAPCPSSPNCVSSLSEEPNHRVAPLRYAGSRKAARDKLLTLIKTLPRSRVVAQTETYLHVEFATPVLRFVDDVEFSLDTGENLIHVRSASRKGYYDFGVNRRRVEQIRRRFAQTDAVNQ